MQLNCAADSRRQLRRVACHTRQAAPCCCGGQRLATAWLTAPPCAALLWLPQASLWSLAAVTCALSCLLCFLTFTPLDYIEDVSQSSCGQLSFFRVFSLARGQSAASGPDATSPG